MKIVQRRRRNSLTKQARKEKKAKIKQSTKIKREKMYSITL